MVEIPEGPHNLTAPLAQISPGFFQLALPGSGTHGSWLPRSVLQPHFSPLTRRRGPIEASGGRGQVKEEGKEKRKSLQPGRAEVTHRECAERPEVRTVSLATRGGWDLPVYTAVPSPHLSLPRSSALSLAKVSLTFSACWPLLLRPSFSTETKCLALLPLTGSSGTLSDCRLAAGAVNLPAKELASGILGKRYLEPFSAEMKGSGENPKYLMDFGACSFSYR